MARTTNGTRLQLETLRAALETAKRRVRAATAGGRLHGRLLVLARAAWLAVAAITVALYVANVWVWIGRVRGSCPPNVCVHGQVPPAVIHALAALHLTPASFGWNEIGLNVLFAAGFAVVAAVLFWRRSHDPLVLYISLALLLFGLGAFEGGFLEKGLPAVSPGWRLPVALLGLLGELAFGIFVVTFPDGHFVPRWSLLAMVLLLLWWVPISLFPGSAFDFTTWPGVAYFAGWVVLLGAMGGAQLYRYRRISTPRQRLQTKWVVFGFVVAGIGYFVGQLVVFFFARRGLTSPAAVLADRAGYTLAYASILLIPISIAIAMLRHHLFDIDVIIRRTVIYSLVTATLATIYAVCSIVLQAGFEAVTGQTSALAAVASTLAIAALFVPVRSRVQATVDRRFYRQKYDAAKTVAAFGRTLRSELDLTQLTDHLLGVVAETMQPSQVSLWLVRPEDRPPVGEPGDWRRVNEAESAARVTKPVPLPGLFAPADEATS